jgi:hypothetical protein
MESLKLLPNMTEKLRRTKWTIRTRDREQSRYDGGAGGGAKEMHESQWPQAQTKWVLLLRINERKQAQVLTMDHSLATSVWAFFYEGGLSVCGVEPSHLTDDMCNDLPVESNDDIQSM